MRRRGAGCAVSAGVVLRRASKPDATIKNEQNALMLVTTQGVKILCVQVAGLIARRIVCWVSTGDRVQRGERFGLIRFGSRMDTFVPLGTVLRVAVGDRVKGGETILARIADENDWFAQLVWKGQQATKSRHAPDSQSVHHRQSPLRRVFHSFRLQRELHGGCHRHPGRNDFRCAGRQVGQADQQHQSFWLGVRLAVRCRVVRRCARVC